MNGNSINQSRSGSPLKAPNIGSGLLGFFMNWPSNPVANRIHPQIKQWPSRTLWSAITYAALLTLKMLSLACVKCEHSAKFRERLFHDLPPCGSPWHSSYQTFLQVKILNTSRHTVIMDPHKIISIQTRSKRKSPQQRPFQNMHHNSQNSQLTGWQVETTTRVVRWGTRMIGHALNGSQWHKGVARVRSSGWVHSWTL